MKTTHTKFTCDNCGATTPSRYEANWFQLCVQANPPNDDTQCSGPMLDACSTLCAVKLVDKATAITKEALSISLHDLLDRIKARP